MCKKDKTCFAFQYWSKKVETKSMQKICKLYTQDWFETNAILESIEAMSPTVILGYKADKYCKITCDTPQIPENGGVEYTTNEYMGSALFSCQEGYTLTGSDQVKCTGQTENGGWSDSFPVCEVIDEDDVVDDDSTKEDDNDEDGGAQEDNVEVSDDDENNEEESTADSNENTENQGFLVSEADKIEIVGAHNAFRSNVSPTATNMQKMVWDDELANGALDWVSQCTQGHDENDYRKAILGWGIGVGQNGAYASYALSWTKTVGMWHGEVAWFEFGKGSTNGSAVGHYTQVVRHESAKVGCAYAECPNHEYVNQYVCNYALIQPDFTHPYTEGSSCSSCPDSCENNLCNCNGKVCKNGGTLDIATCQCSCSSIYTGDVCETLDCPAEDGSSCGSFYTLDKCTEWTNVPIECPYMCGVCESSCADITCLNGGKLSQSTCQCECESPYTGSTCETKSCPDEDHSYCTTWGVDGCTTYTNVPGMCPYMCGIC